MPGDTAALEQRIGRLEQLLASAVQPAYTPLSGLKVNPDGSIFYDFDGHLHARGLDLDAIPGFVQLLPPADRIVQWLRTDASRAAALHAYAVSGVMNTLAAGAISPSGAQLARIDASARDGAPGVSELRALAGPSAGPAQAVIYDAGGNSSFPQWSSGVQARQVGLYYSQLRFGGPVGGGATVTFPNVPAGLALPLFVGSAYQTIAGAMAFVDCSFDGVGVGSLSVYMNEALSHRALVPLFGGAQFVGNNLSHTMSFAVNTGANGTSTDASDVFQAVLMVL